MEIYKSKLSSIGWLVLSGTGVLIYFLFIHRTDLFTGNILPYILITVLLVLLAYAALAKDCKVVRLTKDELIISYNYLPIKKTWVYELNQIVKITIDDHYENINGAAPFVTIQYKRDGLIKKKKFAVEDTFNVKNFQKLINDLSATGVELKLLSKKYKKPINGNP